MDVITIPGKGYDSNIYLILGKKTTIIDTGTGMHNTSIIKDMKHHCAVSDIKQIILTHEHYDHVGGTPGLLSITDDTCKLFAFEAALPTLQKGESMFASLLGGTMPKVAIDYPLKDGDTIVLGNDEFSVLGTPGHSPGSMCLYNKTHNVLFSGDTVFADGGFGRYDFPGGDLHQLQESVQRLTHLSIDSLYPGHGPVVTRHGESHIQQAYQNICQCASYL